MSGWTQDRTANLSFLRSVRAMKAPGSESFIRNHSSFLRKGRHYRFCLSWCLSPKEESLTWAPQGARKRGHLSEVDVNSVCVFSGKRRASLSSQKVVWSPFHPGASPGPPSWPRPHCEDSHLQPLLSPGLRWCDCAGMRVSCGSRRPRPLPSFVALPAPGLAESPEPPVVAFLE